MAGVRVQAGKHLTVFVVDLSEENANAAHFYPLEMPPRERAQKLKDTMLALLPRIKADQGEAFAKSRFEILVRERALNGPKEFMPGQLKALDELEADQLAADLLAECPDNVRFIYSFPTTLCVDPKTLEGRKKLLAMRKALSDTRAENTHQVDGVTYEQEAWLQNLELLNQLILAETAVPTIQAVAETTYIVGQHRAEMTPAVFKLQKVVEHGEREVPIPEGQVAIFHSGGAPSVSRRFAELAHTNFVLGISTCAEHDLGVLRARAAKNLALDPTLKKPNLEYILSASVAFNPRRSVVEAGVVVHADTANIRRYDLGASPQQQALTLLVHDPVSGVVRTLAPVKMSAYPFSTISSPAVVADKRRRTVEPLSPTLATRKAYAADLFAQLKVIEDKHAALVSTKAGSPAEWRSAAKILVNYFVLEARFSTALFEAPSHAVNFSPDLIRDQLQKLNWRFAGLVKVFNQLTDSAPSTSALQVICDHLKNQFVRLPEAYRENTFTLDLARLGCQILFQCELLALYKTNSARIESASQTLLMNVVEQTPQLLWCNFFKEVIHSIDRITQLYKGYMTHIPQVSLRASTKLYRSHCLAYLMRQCREVVMNAWAVPWEDADVQRGLKFFIEFMQSYHSDGSLAKLSSAGLLQLDFSCSILAGFDVKSGLAFGDLEKKVKALMPVASAALPVGDSPAIPHELDRLFELPNIPAPSVSPSPSVAEAFWREFASTPAVPVSVRSGEATAPDSA